MDSVVWMNEMLLYKVMLDCGYVVVYGLDGIVIIVKVVGKFIMFEIEFVDGCYKVGGGVKFGLVKLVKLLE